MNSHYLAQYLVNRDRFTVAEIGELLSRTLGTEPKLPLIAMRHELVSAEEIEKLDFTSADDFARAAVAAGILTQSQVDNLSQVVTGETLRFAQTLLKEKNATYSELEGLLAEYDALEEHPVRTAVKRAAEGKLPEEIEYYADYMELFMQSLMLFLHTPAVVSPRSVLLMEDDTAWAVSQHMYGDISITGGILASESAFLELARRYSREEMERVDELAIDSLEEFLNVMNGLFCVKQASRKRTIDLSPPRSGKSVLPVGSQQLVLRVYTDFGHFQAIMAGDEFM